uniref:Telomerase RNA component interacting RNase n=1 Tax=Apteryx owenii TaxID=8824 RepID=A0A8B9NXG2_APTOW
PGGCGPVSFPRCGAAPRPARAPRTRGPTGPGSSPVLQGAFSPGRGSSSHSPRPAGPPSPAPVMPLLPLPCFGESPWHNPACPVGSRYQPDIVPAAPAPRVTVAVFCPFTQVGRRRGGNKLALKTGVVAKKQKTEEEVLTSKGDAWAKYMAEVKKYKAHQCSDDDKTRPLVK